MNPKIEASYQNNSVLSGKYYDESDLKKKFKTSARIHEFSDIPDSLFLL